MSNEIIKIEEIKHALDILNKVFDSVRFVRPKCKRIVNFSQELISDYQCNCYDIWNREKVCDNCISIRALNEKKIFSKLDWVDNKIFMVIAVTVQDTDETIILELLQDVTSSMLLGESEFSKYDSLLKALAEVNQLQIRDGLTGIFNRRFIDERLPINIYSNSINFNPYTVIFADIDHFKKANDIYGHIAGDHVLKKIAEILQNNIFEKEDWVARYGGEEFLIYKKVENLAAAVEFAEKLRNKVESSEFVYKDSILRITMSLGVFFVSKDYDIKVEELIERADINLYSAKSNGRNKVVASEQ